MSKKGSHASMPRKLAEALLESGVQYYDQPVQSFQSGGTVQGPSNSVFGQVGSGVGNAIGQPLQGISQGLTAQNEFFVQNPTITTQNFIPQISALQSRQAEVYNQQQHLARALLAQTQGQGPNPAQAMLNQQTGQNVQQQAALMAGVRGGSINPALIARQAALQGAGAQQQSVGQAAALNAQQQIAAQNALMQQQQAMAGNALQGENIKQGALASQNQTITEGQLGAAGLNRQTAAENTRAINQTSGSLLSAAGLGLLAHRGGVVPRMSSGGLMKDPEGGAPLLDTDSPTLASNVSGTANYSKGSGINIGGGGDSEGGSDGLQFGKKGGGGGLLGGLLNDGGMVPGQAPVRGDSVKNDVVPALLSPGEIVLPRTVVQGKDAPEKAAEFVRYLMKSGGQPPPEGYGAVVSARQKKMNRGGYC